MQHGDDHLPQAVLNQVPDVHDGDEPRVPDVRVHGEVLSVPDVQECVAKSEVRCSLPWSQQNLRSCRAVVKPLLSPAVIVVQPALQREAERVRGQGRARV